MRKLIYFPIVSLMAVTGKSRPQGKQASSSTIFLVLQNTSESFGL